MTDFESTTLTAWRTSNRVTIFLVENLPRDLWNETIPGSRRTFRSLVAHLHNARCMWLKTLGRENGIGVPASVDHRKVTPRQLAAALEKSSRGMEALFRLAFENEGSIPPTKAYAWRNLPLDIGHVFAYFVAHEAHHRGQIVLAARMLGKRLPNSVRDGLWQFRTHSRS